MSSESSSSLPIEGTVVLKNNRDRRLRNFYPWVQKNEIAHVEGSVSAGGLVEVLSAEREFVGIGTYNRAARFRVRMLTLHREPIDANFFADRLRRALAARGPKAKDEAFRWVFSECDGLSGLIVDVYAGHAVVQVRSAGMEKMRSLWQPALIEIGRLASLTERSDMAGRAEEGLEPISRTLHGSPLEEVIFRENELVMAMQPMGGLKTGYYLDQVQARALLQSRVKEGDEVLDCFTYHGGFALHAAKGGAKVAGLDILPEALQVARMNAQRNGLTADWIEANAFEFLPNGAEGKRYDWIILDPPAIAKQAPNRDSLKWAIWKLVHGAIPCLKPGGRLVVCNCSFQLDLKETMEICRLAGSDQRTQMFLEDITIQSPDHPALLQFPESLYLKSLWLRTAAEPGPVSPR